MKNKSTILKQKFIINLLKPYILDNSICGYNDNSGMCLYLTEDGRQCAIGKHMKKGEWQKHYGDIESLSEEYDLSMILKKSILKHDISLGGLSYIQIVHDIIAEKESYTSIINNIGKIEKVEQVDLTELKELLNSQFCN